MSEYLTQRWYVIENDMYGGWSYTNADVKKASELDLDSGQRDLGDALTKEVAEHIVALHNAQLDVDRKEYALQYRYKLDKDDEWTDWKDGSGYNNKHDGKFRHLGALKGVITQRVRWYAHHHASEYRILERSVVELPWAEHSVISHEEAYDD